VTPDEFAALFERFRWSAFRLEARDDYSVPDEEQDLATFLDGREVPPRTPDNDSWLALVARAAGRSIVRVRVVGRPVTESASIRAGTAPHMFRAPTAFS
jgi:Family of unknown function (DUF6879)